MSHARALAASRNMLVEADVDLIQEALRQVDAAITSPHRPLWAVDAGAGSGTTALAVLEVPTVHALTLETVDIDHDNLAWCELAVHNFAGGQPGGQPWDHHTRCIDSVAAAISYRAGDVDLLLIDTSHEYAHTVLEIEAWRRPMHYSHGLVWFHDYVGGYPGVTLAIDEAVAAGQLEILEQRGLGVLCRYIRHDHEAPDVIDLGGEG
jgi:hypothetical protein